jgi:ethanolamine ammonia-lyase large subunit
MADRAALVKELTIGIAKADDFGAELLTAAIDLIRDEVLEEAANVADRYEIPLCETSASHIAAAIRALKGGT